MRIAIVHSFYGSEVPSGENAVVSEQAETLAAAGHDVLLSARRTDDDRRQPLYPIRSAGRVLTGRGPDPTDELAAFRPDVVHVHNLFPNFGTHWLRSWRGPVVATLHNYRPVCANGLLFRDGHACEDCPTGSPLSAVQHACYHGSRLATIPLAARNARGTKANDVLARADRLICPSERAAATYRRLAGDVLPFVVIPNVVHLPSGVRDEPSNKRWLVVARLSREKGVAELVRQWPDEMDLDIVGSGPDKTVLAAAAGPRVHLLGARSHDEVLTMMPSYAGLLFPSRWEETQGMVLAEAMASGVPIVALRDNAGGDLVDRFACGATYSGVSDLASALSLAADGRKHFADRGRAAYEAEFSRRAWTERIADLYAGLTPVADR